MRSRDRALPERFGRAEFCSERFHYEPGEHVVFSGPTQHGKTTLAFQLLEWTCTPELPAYVAVCKPRDPATQRWGAKLGFRRVEDWPPPPLLQEVVGLQSKPRGYLVWPRMGDVNTDIEVTARVTRALLEDRYAAGAREGKRAQKGILVMDDTMVKSKILKLDDIMTTHLAMAGAMDLGGWYFVQKPTDSGRAAIWSYGQSEHVFMLNDPDIRNQQRYGEIGGVDPAYVRYVLSTLTDHEFLYVKRSGEMAIVAAQ